MREMLRKWLRTIDTKGPWSLAYIYKKATSKDSFDIKTRHSFIKVASECGIYQVGPDEWRTGGNRSCPECGIKIRWALKYCFDCGTKGNPDWLS